jgi:hypothetical protein
MRNLCCFALALRQMVIVSLTTLAMSWHSGHLQAIPMPTTNLLVWLDGQDINGNGSNPTLGTPVMQWTDKSGNGFHAIQSNVAQQPIYTAAQINTYAALLFDGVNDLSPIKRAVVSPAVTQFSAFFVWKLNSQVYSTPDWPVFFHTGDVNGAGRYTGLELGQFADGTANTLDFFGGFGSDERGTKGPPRAIAGTGFERMLSWTSTSTHNTLVWQDGSSVSTSNTGTDAAWNFVIGNGLNAGDNFGVGGYEWPSIAGGSAYIHESVGEVLLYSSVLSTEDRQLVEGILAWKWGLEGELPTDHPYFNINPNVEAVVPEPSCLLLTSIGIVGLAIQNRRRRAFRSSPSTTDVREMN